LASIDDSSDHVLRVWDWDKTEGKPAEKTSEAKTTKVKNNGSITEAYQKTCDMTFDQNFDF